MYMNVLLNLNNRKTMIILVNKLSDTGYIRRVVVEIYTDELIGW